MYKKGDFVVVRNWSPVWNGTVAVVDKVCDFTLLLKSLEGYAVSQWKL